MYQQSWFAFLIIRAHAKDHLQGAVSGSYRLEQKFHMNETVRSIIPPKGILEDRNPGALDETKDPDTSGLPVLSISIFLQ
jgi:hypothetical protein